LVDLQIHTSVVTTDIKSMLAGVQKDVSAMSAFMALVFQKLRSPEERELLVFAESRGGIDKIVANDSLLSDLFGQATSRKDRLGKDSQEAGVKNSKSPSALREESEKDPDDVVKADAKTFENKFDAVRVQFDQLKQTVRRESDRIIDEMQKGPHERILDRVLFHDRQGIMISYAFRTCTTYGGSRYEQAKFAIVHCHSRSSGLERQREGAPSRHGHPRSFWTTQRESSCRPSA
jgi:hypothetical protein